MTSEYMAWIDLETTGLNPARDYTLEIALVVTDTGLIVKETLSIVITDFIVVPFDRVYSTASGFVQEMHEKSGLWHDIQHPPFHPLGTEVSTFTAQERLLNVLGKWFDPTEPKPPMCGSSVGFDRGFLAAQFGTFHNRFSYRNIDVSTIKELAERWSPDVFVNRPGEDESAKIHRALPDVLASIAELKYYVKSEFIDGPRLVGGDE